MNVDDLIKKLKYMIGVSHILIFRDKWLKIETCLKNVKIKKRIENKNNYFAGLI